MLAAAGHRELEVLTLYAILLSVVLAAAFLVVLRYRPRWTIAVAVAPFLLFYLLSPDLRVYSIHGMVHTGIVYHLMGGTLPADRRS